MAKNTNRNVRRGWIRQRSQFYDDYIGAWVKRDTATGRILDVKKSGPWKAIRFERPIDDLHLTTKRSNLPDIGETAA